MRKATGQFVTFGNHHASSWVQPWTYLIFICDCESKNGHYYSSVPPLSPIVFHLQFIRSLKNFRVNVSPIHSKNLTICFLFCVGHANCFSIRSTIPHYFHASPIGMFWGTYHPFDKTLSSFIQAPQICKFVMIIMQLSHQVMCDHCFRVRVRVKSMPKFSIPFH